MSTTLTSRPAAILLSVRHRNPAIRFITTASFSASARRMADGSPVRDNRKLMVASQDRGPFSVTSGLLVGQVGLAAGGTTRAGLVYTTGRWTSERTSPNGGQG